jgi:hypothetical protein
MPQRVNLDAARRTIRILWVSLVALTLLIAGHYFYRSSSGAIHPPRAPEPVMFYAIACMAVAVAAVSFLLPRISYRKAASRLREELRGQPEDEQLRALLPAFQTAFILGMALSESVTLFGYVLGNLGFAPSTCAPFFAAGTLFCLVRYPSDQAILAGLDG